MIVIAWGVGLGVLVLIWMLAAALDQRLQALLALTGRIEARLRAVQGQETAMARTLDEALADITALGTVADGISAAVTAIIAQEADIARQLREALASGDPAKVTAVVDALEANTARLETQRQALVDAVTANTPAPPDITV